MEIWGRGIKNGKTEDGGKVKEGNLWLEEKMVRKGMEVFLGGWRVKGEMGMGENC